MYVYINFSKELNKKFENKNNNLKKLKNELIYDASRLL